MPSSRDPPPVPPPPSPAPGPREETPVTGAAWTLRTPEAAAAALDAADPGGLAEAEVARRQVRFGPNALAEGRRRGPVRIFVSQLLDFMIGVLLVAAGISALLGEVIDAAAIVAIVLLNAVVGFVQEWRAEQAVAALKALAPPTARVRRAGRDQQVEARTLVPGDTVLLEAGDLVPADLRLVEVSRLRTQEAALTGESESVVKVTRALDAAPEAVGDRTNMAFKGTSVVAGRGRGLAVATGMQTELGHIAGLLAEQERLATPLQRRLAGFGRRLAVVVLGISAVLFGVGLLQGSPALTMFLTAVSLAVAAIPEALPAVVTMSLAVGARRMAHRNALVRRLAAVESLGSVTWICSDKTGTLTRNEMEAQVVEPADEDRSARLHEAMALVADVSRDPEGGWRGDPTETALVAAADLAGTAREATENRLPRLGQVPFDSERKRMSTFHGDPGGGVRVLVKGAPEEVLPRCVAGQEAERLRQRADALARDGLRVLAFAERALEALPGEDAQPDAEASLTPLGLVGLLDPPRPEVPAAVAECRAAGIVPVMITGDHPATARAVARAVGLVDGPGPAAGEGDAPAPRGVRGPAPEEAVSARTLGPAQPAGAGVPGSAAASQRPAPVEAVAGRELRALTPQATAGGPDALGPAALGASSRRRAPAEVVTGRALRALDPDTLAARVEDIGVYARVDPEQKIAIVQALQAKGQLVAMTGDGVNDAPALKRADVGVAMGQVGTEVAREAAALVLLDDNFATIVAAVREGRRIFDNIEKFVRFALGGNLGEILTVFLAPLLGLPIPLLPAQILWVNLITDGLPGLALATEGEEPGVMTRPPKAPSAGLFDREVWLQVVWVGALIGALTLGTQALTVAWPGAPWQTMTFTVLVLVQLGHVQAIRSTRVSTFTLGLFSNHPMVLATAITVGLQLLVIYWPPLQTVFRTEALSAVELGICAGVSSVVFFAIEGEKWVRRRAQRK